MIASFGKDDRDSPIVRILNEVQFKHINSSADPENREQDLKQIKLAMNHVERQQKRLLDAYLNEAFDMERLKDEGDRLDARKESLLADRKLLHDAQVTSEAMDRSTTEFDGFLAEIAVGLEALTFEERQKMLRLIVEKITYENGKARVEIVIPPAPVESEGATAKLHNRLPEPDEGCVWWARATYARDWVPDISAESAIPGWPWRRANAG